MDLTALIIYLRSAPRTLDDIRGQLTVGGIQTASPAAAIAMLRQYGITEAALPGASRLVVKTTGAGDINFQIVDAI